MVLREDSGLLEARELETRLHEEAGRFERAALSLRARIELSKEPSRRIELLLELAQIQDIRLRSPSDALQSLEAAFAIDPSHPVPREEILRMLESKGGSSSRFETRWIASRMNPRPQKIARVIGYVRLKSTSGSWETTIVRHLLTHAPFKNRRKTISLWTALSWVSASRRAAQEAFKRRDQVPSGFRELDTLWSTRLERSKDPSQVRRYSLDLALIAMELGKDPAQIKSFLEAVLVDDPPNIPALRLLEHIARTSSDAPYLARTLSRQADAFVDPVARTGALYALLALEEWKLPSSDPMPTISPYFEARSAMLIPSCWSGRSNTRPTRRESTTRSPVRKPRNTRERISTKRRTTRPRRCAASPRAPARNLGILPHRER